MITLTAAIPAVSLSFMKYILIALFISFFISAKCRKDKPGLQGKYFGYAKAEINGSAVYFNLASGGLLYNLPDTISLNFEIWDGPTLKESIGIQKIYKRTTLPQRIYKFNYHADRIEKLSSGYYTLRDDGDVLCDIYNVYEPDSLQNDIVITYFNQLTNEIKGTFQATYLIDSGLVVNGSKCRPSAPDTIRIRNGAFHTKLF
jgi:hypothetical protein